MASLEKLFGSSQAPSAASTARPYVLVHTLAYRCFLFFPLFLIFLEVYALVCFKFCITMTQSSPPPLQAPSGRTGDLVVRCSPSHPPYSLPALVALLQVTNIQLHLLHLELTAGLRPDGAHLLPRPLLGAQPGRQSALLPPRHPGRQGDCKGHVVTADYCRVTTVL